MKKAFVTYFLGGAFFVLLTLCVWSCSDDEKETVLEVDQTLTTTGVQAGIDGGFFFVTVKSSGEWKASLPEECDWAGLMKTSGKGDDVICISIDENYNEPVRSTILTLISGDQRCEVPIMQETSNENADYFNISRSKGLAYGYDLRKFKVKNNAVFSLQVIDSLRKTDEMSYGTLLESDKLSTIVVRDVNVDSLETKQDSLCVRMSLNVAYGTFKLGISGGYHSGEDRKTTMKQFKSAADYSSLEARLGYEDVMAIYQDWLDAGKPEDDLRGLLLTSGFSKKLNALLNAKGEAATKQAAKNLVNAYGPAVVVNTQLGGSFVLEFYADSIYTKETMGVDSAKVTAAVKAGVFSLDANVSADYQKIMEEILQHSVSSCEIKGGNSQDQSAIYDDFKGHNYAQLNKSVKAWINGLVTSDDKATNNAELIRVEVVPIWVFVEEGNAQTVLRNYVLETFKGVKEVERLAEDY